MTVERIDFYEDGTCEVVPATPDPIPEGFAELDAYATETHGEHWTVLSQKNSTTITTATNRSSILCPSNERRRSSQTVLRTSTKPQKIICFKIERVSTRS